MLPLHRRTRLAGTRLAGGWLGRGLTAGILWGSTLRPALVRAGPHSGCRSVVRQAFLVWCVYLWRHIVIERWGHVIEWRIVVALRVGRRGGGWSRRLHRRGL